jgi:RNA polymerase sigma-70 factor (ECF subfamily)
MTGTVEGELQRFTEGDIQAFESLFRGFQGEVYGWIVRIIRDPGAAEDLTIETFWRIYRTRSRFDPSRPFGAWARRIATNLALDYLGARRAEEPILGDAPMPRAAGPPPDPAVRSDVRQKVAAAFGELPPKLRAAATLVMIEETPYAEIAEALGISVNGVKSRVFRAARLLRRSLKRRGVCP